MRRLTLIHTNDLHGRLDERAAARLRDLKAAHSGALMLDAGDAISAGNLGVRLGGEPVLVRMSDLGYAAMTLGNRETHPRKECFPRKVQSVRFPLLCGNAHAKNGAPLPVRPWVVLEVEGTRVGVFGVTVPMFTRKQWTQSLCDYWFSPPDQAAATAAAALRPEVDVLIGLTHIGLRRDLALAEALPVLDLVIGGHSHSDLEAPRWAGGVPVVQAYAFGFYAGVPELEVGPAGCVLRSWRRVPLRERKAVA
jgi:2',3'-cyclic-nucleotide 2'-phosphodiesterase (5'-nucleotidase family)